METWNRIVNTVLLGTEKRFIKKEDLDSAFAEQFHLISELVKSKEEAFLQTASVVYNFRQSGFQPLHRDGITIKKADKEDKPYASTSAHAALSDIVGIESQSLLRFWLTQCSIKNQIAQPEWIPFLLNTGMRNKRLRSMAYECTGKRGAWLVQFNPEWKYDQDVEETDIWQIGTLEQRKKFLQAVRKSDPARARDLIKEIWSNENAATRAELIQQFSINAGADDLPLLEELKNDKSVKVREAVIQVLKTIPSSSIVQLYWRLLEPSIELTKEKGLLGLGSKWVLHIFPPKQIDESIYETGIEKMSSEKNVSDYNFLLYQLVMSVPPSFFEKHLNLGADEILKALDRGSMGKDFLPAFGQAAIQFNELLWLRKTIERVDSKLYPEVFHLLPPEEAEQYAIKQLQYEGKAGEIIKHLTDLDNEWSIQLTKAVLRFTSTNSYTYHKGFYEQIIHLIPVRIASDLESFAPKEEHLKIMWMNVVEHLRRLLSLKHDTIKAFTE